jgi:hypothetical protein
MRGGGGLNFAAQHSIQTSQEDQNPIHDVEKKVLTVS